MSDNNVSVLVELAEVKGQLKLMIQLMQQNHEATHQRINDFRHAVEGRVTNVETRMSTLETNERATALKGAGSGAIAGAIMGGAIEALKYFAGRG
ncbi:MULTISPECIES: hypothetical protein [unclassified Polaromonas]|jgi:hypothetical protein|uniref:hypothetical protein n=1 Tax=unclassified Polaromonas TaxID=2638319 RepID=UPI000BC8139C|nr:MULTISPECIES: hypothetical protein [unclassified Polaromonas]OYZ76058.1 MAG: hypothetical protein B7Y09_21770 [Polaromonas sp. 24-63-21]OZA47345.1 MAG: hypothetical protein B7X88_22235 [Polaromonas sp. 17-63-33]